MEESFMANLISKVCKNNDLNLTLGPVLGVSGKISNKKDNQTIYFYNCCFDINSYGASMTSRNKGLTRIFLEDNNIYSMPKGEYFSKEMNIYKLLTDEEFIEKVKEKIKAKLNLPIMVKGADLHRGSCIFKVNEWVEFENAIKNVLNKTNEIVIEEFINFETYRILIYKNEVIACYGKEPFNIIGDGKTTAKKLIENRVELVKEQSIGININDMYPEILMKLKEKGYLLESIIPKGEKIILTDTASISKGGIAIDYTEQISKYLIERSINIAKIMNLNLCGIDIISKSIYNAPEDTYILEVNSSPCLETYAKLGEEQNNKIYNLMEEIILDGLSKGKKYGSR